jgi:phosphoribosylformimino-5-aminoimidazole carboxamide ribotide isomerase
VLAGEPGELVAAWAEAGIRRVQVNDLDAQGDGSAVSAALVGDIAARVPDLSIQVGGGVREEDAVQAYLEAGAHYVVIGMRALSAPHLLRDLCLEYPGHILVALQGREGRVDTDGWSKLANQDVIELGQHFERDGVEAIIYHDAAGKAEGFNLEAARRFARELTIPVLAAGPAAAWEELAGLADAEEDGLAGAVLTEGLVQSDLDMAAVLKLAGSGA